MCGIAGIRFFNSDSQLNNELENALLKIQHRGPDASHVYSNHNTHLGHSRLSIIDINDRANQPMISGDENYSLTFNGEIYNFGELKNDLLKQGCTFKTSSDTEVLLNGLIVYGTDFIQKLDGFFAFAFYDKIKDELVVARDRLGIKPLLYMAGENKFCFSSELMSLLEFDIPRDIDRSSVRNLFKFSYIPAPQTIIKGVNKLMPGCFLRVKGRDVHKEVYYKIEEKELSKLSFDESKRELKKKLEASVANRLISDVPLGTFLSGGYDSSIVTAIAADQKDDLNTFSVGFKDHPYFDESETAKKTAKFLGTRHHAIQIEKTQLNQDLDKILNSFDEPFGDSSAIAVYFLAEETKKNVTVALSGDGADELFAGYNKHRAIYKIFNEGNLALKLVTPFSKLVPSNNSSKLGNISRKIQKFNELKKTDSHKRYDYLASFNQEEIISELLNFQDFEQLTFQELSSVNQFLVQDQQFILPNDMLKKVDVMSMQHSLEVRTPFLDHQLLEFANSLPEKYKIDGSDQKVILKDTFRDMLPKHIFGLPKKGFEVPLTAWLKESISKRLNEEIFTRNYIEAQGLFNFEFINRVKTKEFLENSANSSLIWTLLVFQTWYDNTIKNA